MFTEDDEYYIPTKEEDMLNSLRCIAKRLSKLEYDHISKTYTLSDDEMDWVFYCRDVARHMVLKYDH